MQGRGKVETRVASQQQRRQRRERRAGLTIGHGGKIGGNHEPLDIALADTDAGVATVAYRQRQLQLQARVTMVKHRVRRHQLRQLVGTSRQQRQRAIAGAGRAVGAIGGVEAVVARASPVDVEPSAFIHPFVTMLDFERGECQILDDRQRFGLVEFWNQLEP